MSPDTVYEQRRRRFADARLYFVCDARPAGRDPAPLLDAALRGGVDVIQLREKAPRCAEELISFSEPFVRAAREHGALFILNDRPDLVEACGADGVHVGQDDEPVAVARARAGSAAVVGLSTHSPEQIDAARSSTGDHRPDQISVGPVFETPTKEGRAATGIKLIEHAAAGRDDPDRRRQGDPRRTRSRSGRAGASRRARHLGGAIRRRGAPRVPSRPHTHVEFAFHHLAFGMIVASRERKRTERRKRKERGTQRRSDQARRREEMAARTEAKNEAARAALEPLADGERPTVVTVGAIVSGLIALSVVVGWAAGVEVTKFGSDGIEQGEGHAPIVSVIVSAALMGVMSYGMWRARYWAVLGFQAVLVLTLLAASLGLLEATTWTQAIGTTALLIGAGAMFYFMIKAMARIQMPERPRPE